MGARASVVLRQEGQADSPVLCQHWGGPEFHEEVREFIQSLYTPENKSGREPADRLEPSRVFIKLVAAHGAGGYVECSREAVDDSDYGCLYVNLGDEKPTFSMNG